jgi:hypothetical protein
MQCPICKKPVDEPTGPIRSPFPFCSERCKLIDLGRWLDGEYQIPVAESDDEESEFIPPPQDDADA